MTTFNISKRSSFLGHLNCVAVLNSSIKSEKRGFSKQYPAIDSHTVPPPLWLYIRFTWNLISSLPLYLTEITSPIGRLRARVHSSDVLLIFLTQVALVSASCLVGAICSQLGSKNKIAGRIQHYVSRLETPWRAPAAVLCHCTGIFQRVPGSGLPSQK